MGELETMQGWVCLSPVRHAELLACEAALRALVGIENAALIYVEAGSGEDTYWTYECVYCERLSIDMGRFEHKPDCPIVAGRKLVGEAE